MRLHKTAWAEISTEAVESNLKAIKEQLPTGTRICAMVKGDAYGHGLVKMTGILLQKGLIDIAGVGKVSELIRLLKGTANESLEVLLVGASCAEELEAPLEDGRIDAGRAVFSIFSMSQFEKLEQIAQHLKRRIKVHIRLDGWDSGMGLGYRTFLEEQDRLFLSEWCCVTGIYSHLYSSYYEDHAQTARELEEFDEVIKRLSPERRARVSVHVMNSALIFGFPQYAYDMVRAGAAMYGLECGAGGKLKTAMKICADVFAVHEIDASVPLSYEPVHKTGKRRIARIMLGYCDCPLLLTQYNVQVRIRGQLYPLADDVCMDNLCVDITGNGDIRVGDQAVLLGEPGVSVDEIMERNNMFVVHSDWLGITAERLEKVYV